MAMALGSGGGPKSDINITPYIDILLVLLIIFMVIQPKTQYDLKARVPQKPPEEIEQNVIIKSDAIVVSLDSARSVSTPTRSLWISWDPDCSTSTAHGQTRTCSSRETRTCPSVTSSGSSISPRVQVLEISG